MASAAQRISAHFAPLIAQGWDVVPLTTSCALMLKFEWPLIEPDNEAVALLAKHTFDVSEYVVRLAKDVGLAPIEAMPKSIAVHFACHARAQNMGPKAMEMLRLIPEAKPQLTERCSGHGGKWGIFTQNFDRAIKVGKTAGRNLVKSEPDLVGQRMPARRAALAPGHRSQRRHAARPHRPPDRSDGPSIRILDKCPVTSAPSPEPTSCLCEQYETIRADKKQEAIARKQLTRVSVGPHATALFETWDSMWLQIQEMLRIEKGGEAQIADELAAYDPMVPKGGELTCTMLFEVEDAGAARCLPAHDRRGRALRAAAGGGHVVPARKEGDVVRTRESDGKASAVHFFHFDFTPEAIAAWKDPAQPAMLVIEHANYGHAAIIGPATREYLARECF